MADNGFTIAAFNRTVSKVDRFLENEAKGKSIVGAHSIEEFVSKLKSPRRVMLLVQAGKAVDDYIETLLPLLEKGDIIIDGGNSHFPDSNRRTQYCASKGLRFIGSGVSGGEEGARYGPSMMPGGQRGGLALRQGHLPEHRRQERRRGLLRLGRRRGCWSLRQDGPQRYRVR